MWKTWIVLISLCENRHICHTDRENIFSSFLENVYKLMIDFFLYNYYYYKWTINPESIIEDGFRVQ